MGLRLTAIGPPPIWVSVISPPEIFITKAAPTGTDTGAATGALVTPGAAVAATGAIVPAAGAFVPTAGETVPAAGATVAAAGAVVAETPGAGVGVTTPPANTTTWSTYTTCIGSVALTGDV